MTLSTGITEQDLRQLLDVVEYGAAPEDGFELPVQLLQGLSELIPCATISFFVMDSRRGVLVAGQDLNVAGVPEDEDDSVDLFFQAYWDCIACCYPERYGDHERVTSWRDFYSDREFRKTLMSEYFRSVGVWHELLVTLPPIGGLERRLTLTRGADDLPFTERDRLLLTLLRPHLVSMRDRIEAERRTVPVLTPRQLELLGRVAQGQTNRQIARDLGLSEGTVRKHLENIFARLEVNSRTEAVARMPQLLVG